MATTVDVLTNDDLKMIVSEFFGVKPYGQFTCVYLTGDYLMLLSEKENKIFSYPESEDKAAELLIKLGFYHPGIKSFEVKPSKESYPVINLSMYVMKGLDNAKKD